MRLKLDVAFAQQKLSAMIAPWACRPLGARRRALYISIGCGGAPQSLTGPIQAVGHKVVKRKNGF
jgi:hypothetical protein